MHIYSFRIAPVLCASLLLLLTLSASAKTAEPLDRATQETIVRAAYANLEDYTRLAAPDFALEVDDFRHLRPQQLDSVFWSDLVSPSQGLLVDMEREVRENWSLGSVHSKYEPSFRYVDQVQSADLERLGSMVASDVLAEVVAGDPEHSFTELMGFTSFRVRASFGETERIYRAAFAWVPPRAKSLEQAAFVVLDHVTQGVEEAAIDPFSPAEREDFMAQLSRADRTEKNGPSLQGGCHVSSGSYLDTFFEFDDTHHVTGGLTASAAFAIACSCDAACNNTCTPQISNEVCEETGTPISDCHKMASFGRVSANSKYLQGVSCGGGFICASRSCPFCICGLNVGVWVTTGSGPTTVRFSAGDATWTSTFEFTRTCPPCELVENDGSGGIGGGSGGGGSGGSGPEDGSNDGWTPDTGGFGDGSTGVSIKVYCNGEYLGVVTSIQDALSTCQNILDSGGDEEDPPDEGS